VVRRIMVVRKVRLTDPRVKQIYSANYTFFLLWISILFLLSVFLEKCLPSNFLDCLEALTPLSFVNIPQLNLLLFTGFGGVKMSGEGGVQNLLRYCKGPTTPQTFKHVCAKGTTTIFLLSVCFQEDCIQGASRNT
jgi:hypothetical protein